MKTLTLPPGFALPNLITELSPHDTMFDGAEAHYLGVGLSALNVIENALDGREPRSILDLPCGYGRVTRVLRARFPAAKITACDLDRPAVDFTAKTFDARGVYSVPDFRDLDFGESFDLIWVGSLLTHLPEHLTRNFLDLASRHMDVNSRLVVTTHGEYVANRLPQASYGLTEDAARGLQAEYLVNGYGYRGYDGGPSYGISLTACAWFEQLLAGGELRLQSFYERGWDRHQDVVVLRKQPQKTNIWRRTLGNFSRQPIADAKTALPLPGAEQAKRDKEGVPGFDEQWYCGSYPDIATAKQKGEISTGLSHYMEYGWKEKRAPFDPGQNYDQRHKPNTDAWIKGLAANGINRVARAWSVSPEETSKLTGWYFLAHPAVRSRTNRLASGQPDQDAYDRLAALFDERRITLPVKQSVSIGCGFGNLERDLTARNMIGEIDAYDVAPAAIDEAKRQAAALGLSKIRYHLSNLEQITLRPGSLDAVFAHSSVHHIEKLESLYATIRQALRPGGLFHLHEFVGPNRFQWTDRQLQLANDFLDILPDRLRRQPDGTLKSLRRPTVDEMIAADPSEAVRSAELVAALDPYFNIIEFCPLGGTLTHIALGGIAQNFDPDVAEDMALLQRLFTAEDIAMERGEIGSDFATITAIPKPLREAGG